MQKRQTVFLLSLGCPKNLVDSEELIHRLSADFSITNDPKDADIIIINTCAFIKSAAQEAIEKILEAAKYKKSGRCKKLVVAGCLTKRYKGSLVKALPEVDLFIGPAEIPLAAKLLSEDERGLHASHATYVPKGKTLRASISSKHAAYLKIGDGCSRRCSYCTIPEIRGPFKSRPAKDIVAEAAYLFHGGASEITFISQDTSCYGLDIKTNILKLLEKLEGLASPKRWMRIMYSQPSKMLVPLAEFLVETQGFAPYLDVPIQHASKKILKLMNRPSFTPDIIRRLRKIKGLFLRTTVMTGFPGETERDFKELLRFLSEIEFDHLGVFPYSPETGTAAYSLPARPLAKTALMRSERVMELQSHISRRCIEALKGKTVRLLVESKANDKGMICRHIGQGPEVDGITKLTALAKVGDIIRARIVDVDGDYDLVAQKI